MLLDAGDLEPRSGDRGGPRGGPAEPRGPGEARADAVGARDRDQAVPGRARRPGEELRHAAPHGGRRSPRSWGCCSPPPEPTRSRLWEDQKIVDRPRYEELVDELGFIARQELIFGTHVHVAIDGPDRAIYVADGHPPLPAAAARALGQLALLARASDRDDVLAHAGLPRLPARRHPAALRHLGDLLEPGRADDARRRDRGLHVPVVGRAPASRTSARSRRGSSTSRRTLEHTIGLAALTISLAHRMSALYDAEAAAGRVPDRAGRRQQGPRGPARHGRRR